MGRLSLAESVRLIVRTGLESRLLPEGPATDYSRDRVRSTAEKGQAPPEAGDFLREWEDLVERVALAMWRDLERVRRGEGRVSGKRKDKTRDSRIAHAHAYVGRSPEWVGALEGCTAQHVERVRDRAGLDKKTGERLPRRAPLTSRDLPAEEA